MLKNFKEGCTHQGVGVVGILNLLRVEGAKLQLFLLPLLLLGCPLSIRPEQAKKSINLKKIRFEFANSVVYLRSIPFNI